MPAEWEPHEAIWMAWPHYRGEWQGKFEPIRWVYAEIIRNLAPHGRVELVVADRPAERQARKLLERADVLLTNVRFHHWPTNRVWMRDSGCIFVTPQEPGFAQPDSREPARSSEALSEAQGLPKGRLSPHAPALALKFRFNSWTKYSNSRQAENIGSLIANAAAAPELRPLFASTPAALEGGLVDVSASPALVDPY